MANKLKFVIIISIQRLIFDVADSIGQPYLERSSGSLSITLLRDFAKSGNLKIGCWYDRIVLQFHKSFGNSAADTPVKFPNDLISLNLHLAALRLCKVWRWDVLLMGE